jgi:hypothetical protein
MRRLAKATVSTPTGFSLPINQACRFLFAICGVPHLAGLQRGDTREYVSSIFGPPTSGPKQDSSGFRAYPHNRDDGSSIRVNYDNNIVTSVKAYSKGSRSAPDPLLSLLGKNESAAVALLGLPKTRESLWDINSIGLVWSFPALGRAAESRPEPESMHTRGRLRRNTLRGIEGLKCNRNQNARTIKNVTFAACGL